MSALADAVESGQLTETTLGSLAEYVTSGSRDWSKYYAASGAMFIRTQDINQNRLSLDDVAYVELPPKVEGKRSLVRKGDLLITITGANVGKVAVVDHELGEAYVSQSVCLVRLKDPSLAKFLQLQLIARRGEKSALEAMAYGLGRPVLNLENVRAAPVKVGPPTIRAQLVAEIEKQFSRLDEAVANLERVRANLKHYEAAVLRAAVEGRLVQTEAELRDREGGSVESGGLLLARVLLERRRRWVGKGTYQEPACPAADGLPPLPEGWAWARLDAVAALKGGITVDKKRRDSTARLVPYLRVANVQRGYLDLNEVKEIEAPQADIEELRLQPGDILFNEGGDRDKLGRGWIWEGKLAECIHQNHVFRARPYLAEVSGKLISWWGNTFGKDYFLREGKQTTNLASINMTKLSAFPVPIPPAAEQQRIVAEVDRRLSIVREVEAEVVANLKRAQALRQAVLSQVFSE